MKAFNEFDRFYEACHHDIPLESPDTCYDTHGASCYPLARIDKDIDCEKEIFAYIVEENHITLRQQQFNLRVPSAAVVRRMDNPTTITKKDNYCTCFMFEHLGGNLSKNCSCLLYTSPSPRDLSTSRMPSSA